jgi:hypothetical protein
MWEKMGPNRKSRLSRLAPGRPTKLRVNDVLDMFEQDAQGVWRFRSRIIARQLAVVVPAD